MFILFLERVWRAEKDRYVSTESDVPGEMTE